MVHDMLLHRFAISLKDLHFRSMVMNSYHTIPLECQAPTTSQTFPKHLENMSPFRLAICHIFVSRRLSHKLLTPITPNHTSSHLFHFSIGLLPLVHVRVLTANILSLPNTSHPVRRTSPTQGLGGACRGL